MHNGQPHSIHNLPPGADCVDRQDSACQKQFNPGEETYRCIDCELTDDTPGNCLLFIYLSIQLFYYGSFLAPSSSLIKLNFYLVLCRNCFEASEHRHHQWEMLRDEGGGWCDCGDRTAWREPYVFCTFHAPQECVYFEL